MCQDCFQNSVHTSHNFKKRVSNGGTACNCGEVDVWHSAPYCFKHAPTTSAPAGREPPSTSSREEQWGGASSCGEQWGGAGSWEEQWGGAGSWGKQWGGAPSPPEVHTPRDPPHRQPEAPPTGATVTMNEPICLIDTGRDGRMSVQQEALQILEQIQQPVVVVAVVGLYRTGKSYLMNRLAGKQRGFALGSTIESKTKGIWMWCVPHPFKDGHTLVLLDTEGLGDVEKGDEKHDTWIFCLAVLLSSTLVYNSLGTIDNSALEKLQFVTELTEHIRVKSSDHRKNTELMLVFPSFVWTVRDFTLELQLNGKTITADEYLENSLKLKPGSSPDVARRNLVRQSLKEFFAVRRCFVMDRPASAAKMKRMEQLTDADLEPSFVEQAQQFCSYIHQQAPVKTMRGGRGLTGRMLGSLAETYVEAIRSGKVPCLESAVEALAKIHNSRAVAEALDFYRAEMTQKVQFPTETQEALSTVHSAVAKQAASKFMKASFNDQDEKHLLLLKEGIEKEYGELCKRNVKESRKVCWSVIRRVFASLEHELSNGSYMRPGGYNDFRSALDHGAQVYRSEKGKGIMSEDILSEYLEEKNVVGKSIRAADQTLSESQKKMEEERIKREEAEQRRKLLEEQNQIQQQAMRDLEESNAENLRQLALKLERENENAKLELDRVLSAKLKEQEEQLEGSHKKRIDELKDDIKKLKQERDRVDVDKPVPEKKKKPWWKKVADGLQNVGMVAAVVGPGPVKVLGLGAVATGAIINMFD
ncbi:hypothetical protein ACEWY4_005096 [Coilia grayii]|uniref:GB1/RHD3-type G domain-containing protein n=1 Tax=Coilia grayii TaxID=363190 RepID=A0ABD1KHX9_9TELE